MSGVNIVGVQFKRAGKIYDFSYTDLELHVGDKVLVETEWGESLGKVVVVGFYTKEESKQRNLKPILRKLSKREIDKSFHLTADEVTRFTKRKITRLKLDMRVLKTEILYGGSRVIIFFSSPGRVDFRDLVKDLASGLKARVELKQVGPRDETKLLGGVGICGREYCCSSFLREFVPVSIKMAKNQNLALNPTKVSGGCGRLLCCLTYEDKSYQEMRLLLPAPGSEVIIKETDEKANVLKTDLLNQSLQVCFKNSKEIRTYKLEEVNITNHIRYEEEE
jgi:cell fate regulator YaaT (PSP1 superfamily)